MDEKVENVGTKLEIKLDQNLNANVSSETLAAGTSSAPMGFLVQVRQLVEEIVSRENCSLYDLEFVGLGSNRALRVYIDKEGAASTVDPETGGSIDTGVSIDDCSNVSRALSEALEANEDMIPGGAYNLEVSSPGLERTLRDPQHFEKAIGKKIAVRASQALLQFNESVPQLGLAKQIQGRLVAVDFAGQKDGLWVSFDEVPKLPEGAEPPVVFVPFDTVTKAHVVFEFQDPSEKKPKKSGYKKSSSEKRGHS